MILPFAPPASISLSWPDSVTANCDSLSPDEQERLRAEALAKARSDFVQQYCRSQGDPKLSAGYLKIILEGHIAGLLGIAWVDAGRG